MRAVCPREVQIEEARTQEIEQPCRHRQESSGSSLNGRYGGLTLELESRPCGVLECWICLGLDLQVFW